MQQTKIPLTDEEQANLKLLETTDGILTERTDPNKLIQRVLPGLVCLRLPTVSV